MGQERPVNIPIGCELPPNALNIQVCQLASLALEGTASEVGNASPIVKSFKGGLSKIVRTRRAPATWTSISNGTENQFTEMAGGVKGSRDRWEVRWDAKKEKDVNVQICLCFRG